MMIFAVVGKSGERLASRSPQLAKGHQEYCAGGRLPKIQPFVFRP